MANIWRQKLKLNSLDIMLLRKEFVKLANAAAIETFGGNDPQFTWPILSCNFEDDVLVVTSNSVKYLRRGLFWEMNSPIHWAKLIDNILYYGNSAGSYSFDQTTFVQNPLGHKLVLTTNGKTIAVEHFKDLWGDLTLRILPINFAGQKEYRKYILSIGKCAIVPYYNHFDIHSPTAYYTCVPFAESELKITKYEPRKIEPWEKFRHRKLLSMKQFGDIICCLDNDDHITECFALNWTRELFPYLQDFDKTMVREIVYALHGLPKELVDIITEMVFVGNVSQKNTLEPC